MINLHQETAALASWPTDERRRALQRIIPRARVDAALAQSGRDRTHCRRLPGWFMVWFMIALGLCCRDAYRQLFRWLQPFRPGGIPGRSTLCEARQRLGVAPLRALAAQVVALLGRPETPGAFYRGMRTMALDGFVLNMADTPANERAFGRPGSWARARRLSAGAGVGPVRDRQPRHVEMAGQVVALGGNHHGAIPAALPAA